MEQLIELVKSVPTWIWVVLALVVFFMKTGKVYKKLWDYEVEFSLKDEIGWGEVDFESREHKGEVETKVCIKLQLVETQQGKDVDIYLNGQKVCTLPKEKNRGSRAGFNFPITIDEPSVGDIVSVRINEQELFSGSLALD